MAGSGVALRGQLHARSSNPPGWRREPRQLARTPRRCLAGRAGDDRRPCRRSTVALVQHDDSSPSSTSSIRCVAQSTLMPSLSTQPADVARMLGARLDVEPDRRLVEQQQRRPVQQRARDLDAPHLAAGEAARLVVQRGSVMPTVSSSASIRRRASRRGRCRAARHDRRGSASTDRSRSSVRAWNTMPSRRSASPGARRRHGRRCGSSRGVCRRAG